MPTPFVMIAVSVLILASIPWLILARCRADVVHSRTEHRYLLWYVVSFESIAFCGLFLGLGLLSVAYEHVNHSQEIVTNLLLAIGALFGVWGSTAWIIGHRLVRIRSE